MVLTKEQKADKWKLALQNSVDIAQANVNAMTVSPASLAIAQKAAMLTNFADSVNSGKWEENLSPFLDISKWQTRMVAGLERNRTITDGQLTKVTEHFGVQGYATSQIDAIIPLIDAVGNGVENSAGYTNVMQKIFVNIAVNTKIDIINEGDSAQEILDIIAALLIATYGYTASI